MIILYINKKYAVILFHKNIKKLYKWRWIEKCLHSILNQSYKNYDIFEINYGGDEYSLFDDIRTNNNLFFFNNKFDTHTEAMVFLLNKCFYEYNYDVVFNTNLDDFYHIDRFSEQIKCINNGYILCTTLMEYITEENDTDKSLMLWSPDRYGFENISSDQEYIDIENIRKELNKDHNVFNHPNICYTKQFWTSFTKDNILLRYRDDKPFEDLSLWQRAVDSFNNITIINKSLIYYRIHENQIGEVSKKLNTINENCDGGFHSEPNKEKLIIGIFCVCTGNYVNYLEDLIASVELNFLNNYKKCYFISTDQILFVEKICKKLKIKYNIDLIYKKGFR